MTTEEKQLFDFLVEYYTDKVTAKKIINGGYQGYCYAGCGYQWVNSDELDDDYIQGQKENLIMDESLPYDGYVLVGGMI